MKNPPIEVVRDFADDYLPRLWTTPEELFWMFDPDSPPNPLTRCFVDAPCMVPAEPSRLGTRFVLHGHDRKFTVACSAGIGGPGDSHIFITAQLEYVVALQTDAVIRPDGVTQIAGAPPGIVLLTAEEVRELQGGKLAPGTVLLEIEAQERSENGTWTTTQAVKIVE